VERRYVVFRIGNSSYGIPIEQVQEITRIGSITPLPQSPPAVLGATNLRGTVVTVVSGHKLLDRQEDYDSDQVVFLKANQRLFGLLVDEAEEVLAINESEIEVPYLFGHEKIFGSSGGIGKVRDRLIVLCDADVLLNQIA